jgi:hypothetical protein
MLPRKMTLATALIFTAGLGAAACAKNEPADQGPGISIEAAPAMLASAVCVRAYQCCTAVGLAPNELAGTDQMSCEIKSTEGFRNNLQLVADLRSKGRVAYHGDKLATCIEYIRSASCPTLNRTNHLSGLDCEPYLEGLVAAGAACSFDVECKEGFCEKPSPMASAGVCKPFAREGEACATVRCRRGLSCDFGSKACVVPPNVDAGPPPEGQCFYSSACAYGGRGRAPVEAALALLALLAWRSRRRK